MIHIPVLTNEVINYLNPKPNENFIDCTFDGGGHAISLLNKTEPNGRVLGIEIDKEILEGLGAEFDKFKSVGRLILINGNFKNLKDIIGISPFSKNETDESYDISGILLDLGLSSWHLEKSKRGFSFQKNEVLDMRYDSKESLTAKEIVNKWPESEIERILREYGEERHSRSIARAIIKERKRKPIITTFNLVDIIHRAVPWVHGKGKIHIATRTFQALRIIVNQELENLKEVLPQSIEILKPGGRLVIISFHSLEDRIIKFFFKREAQNNRIKILTEKPVRPTREEIMINPRARSAKLRAAIKI